MTRKINVVSKSQINCQFAAELDVIFYKNADVMRVPARMRVVNVLAAVTDLAEKKTGPRITRPAAGVADAGRLIAVEVERVDVVLDDRILLVTEIHAELEAVAAFLPAHTVIHTRSVVDVYPILLLAQRCRLVRTGKDNLRIEDREIVRNSCGGCRQGRVQSRTKIDTVGAVVTEVEVVQQRRREIEGPAHTRVVRRKSLDVSQTIERLGHVGSCSQLKILPRAVAPEDLALVPQVLVDTNRVRRICVRCD